MRRAYIFLLASVLGCAAAAPEVEILEVAKPRGPMAAPGQGQTVRVFLEVVNPTGAALQLSRLRYRFSIDDRFVAHGDMVLERAIGAHSAAVIRVPVLVSGEHPWSAFPDGTVEGLAEGGAVPCVLDGRLFATVNRTEHAWDIQTWCRVHSDATARGHGPATPADTRVADSE